MRSIKNLTKVYIIIGYLIHKSAQWFRDVQANGQLETPTPINVLVIQPRAPRTFCNPVTLIGVQQYHQQAQHVFHSIFLLLKPCESSCPVDTWKYFITVKVITQNKFVWLHSTL